jgi:malonyl CoA-acyl carrier protein transacylase
VTRAKAAAIVGFAAALLLGYVAWDRYLSPEARVRRTLEGAAAAAEAADVEALLSFLSSDYADFMHETRSAFEAMARENLGRVDRMNVTVDTVEIDVEQTEARVTFDALVVAIRGEERYVVLGTPFQPERLNAHLKRESEGWKIHRVELPSP